MKLFKHLRKRSKRDQQSDPSGNKSRKALELAHRVLFSRRVIFLLMGVFAGIGALLWRAYYLQVQRRDYYHIRSRRNRIQLDIVAPLRGNIYDRNGIALSQNVLSYDLVVNRAKSQKPDELVGKIKGYMHFGDDDWAQYETEKKQKRYNENLVVRSDLSDDERYRFLVDLYKFPGFDIVPSYKRYYPFGDLTAHVVGYINRINQKDLKTIDKKQYRQTTKIGRTGIERYYESELHGRLGIRQAEISRSGKLIRVLEQIDPIPGKDLYLSLDLSFQRQIRILLEASECYGAVVAINPNSGELLGFYSNPSFDANAFVNGISVRDYNELRSSPGEKLFNRALNGQYSPGSTIKPMMALAALHNGINPDDKVECRGHYRIPNYENARKFFCWKRTGHGYMDTRSSLVQSCDVYYYTVGQKIGIARIRDYLSQFGLGKKTGVDLPAESVGILPSKVWKEKRYHTSWFIGDTINASIGQGYVYMTPLQLAHSTAIIGANGKRFTPHFVNAFRDPVTGKKQAVEHRRYQIKDVAQSRADAWSLVHRAMIGVMQEPKGTAHRVKTHLPFDIAGKTGTAQVFSFKNNKRIKTKDLEKKLRDNSCFITYAPAENPQIALAVILENAGGEGSKAAHVAVKLLEHYFSLNKQGEKVTVRHVNTSEEPIA